jgi:DNA-binding NarL/FixJ family response regulator
MRTISTIQLLVADDYEMVRRGVKALLSGTVIKVTAEAATGRAAVKLALKRDLDVVLLDVRMPDGDGLTALGRIKTDRPRLPVLMFSAFDNPANVARSMALGASGFLLKSCSRNELRSAIRTVVGGGHTWSNENLYKARGSLVPPQLGGNLEVGFSEAEGDVLRQIVNGLSNKRIARTLKIKYEDVPRHIWHILRKIGLVDRTQAAAWAIMNGWG